MAGMAQFLGYLYCQALYSLTFAHVVAKNAFLNEVVFVILFAFFFRYVYTFYTIHWKSHDEREVSGEHRNIAHRRMCTVVTHSLIHLFEM